MFLQTTSEALPLPLPCPKDSSSSSSLPSCNKITTTFAAAAVTSSSSESVSLVAASRQRRKEIRRFKIFASSTTAPMDLTTAAFVDPQGFDKPVKRARVQASILCDKEDRTGKLGTEEVTATIHVEGTTDDTGKIVNVVKSEVSVDIVVSKDSSIEAQGLKRPEDKEALLIKDSTEEQRRRRWLRRRRYEKIQRERNGTCPSHCVVSICGCSRVMEDAAVAVPSFLKLPAVAFPTTTVTSSQPCENDGHPSAGQLRDQDASSYHFFGVYDGHGGPQVAEYCKERLHETLAAEMSVLASRDSTQREEEWKTGFRSCFKKVDEELCGLCSVKGSDPCIPLSASSNPSREPLVSGAVGSTAVVAVVGETCIMVANCGDSRAVLCRGGQAIPLSEDHKANRPDEMARIEAAGGRVFSWKEYGYRVLGVLAMSRALGDRYLKPYVISEPEVTCTQRSDDDECLILASDGLWDVLSNDEVCRAARKCLAGRRAKHSSHSNQDDETNNGSEVNPAPRMESPVQAAAALLTKLALSRNSKDNISVVVVDLKH